MLTRATKQQPPVNALSVWRSPAGVVADKLQLGGVNIQTCVSVEHSTLTCHEGLRGDTLVLAATNHLPYAC